MGERPLGLLLVEDNRGDARLIVEMLAESDMGGYRVEHAERLADGLEALEHAATDVVLLDLSLPDSRGLETFRRLHGSAPSVPVVVLSGLDDQDIALRAVQEGAQDYLVKGQVDAESLGRAIRYAIERDRAQRELERQKDEFLAHVSHDLKTPLAAIKASIGVVLANEPPQTPPAIHRMLTNVDQAADQMARLVDDLLELARLQAGRLSVSTREVDLVQVGQRAVRAIEPLAETRRQQVEVAFPSEPVQALADTERLERALLNLLTNAHKYGPDGGSIRVSLEQAQGEAVFAVSDEGPGIPVADQQRIFERFYRGPQATGGQGSGLGLPIARAFVELHGGRVWVESEPGRGSTFRVAIPTAWAVSANGDHGRGGG